jgi:hypothetical protein
VASTTAPESVRLVRAADGYRLSAQLTVPDLVAEGILEVPESERPARVQLALTAGMPLVRQLGSEALGQALQAGQAQLQSIADQALRQLREAGTGLATGLEEKTASLQKTLLDLFGRDDSVIPAQIRTKVLSAVQELQAEYRTVLQTELGQLEQRSQAALQALSEKIAGVEKALAVQAAVRREAAKGTEKGHRHEDLVTECLANFLSRYAAPELTGRHVGTEKDKQSRTQGDYLVSWNSQPLVIVEAKHQDHSGKSPQAMAKMAATYQNARGAVFTVFVYADVQEAPGHRFLYLDPVGRWISCVVDPTLEAGAFFLEVALQLAVMLGKQVWASQERSVPWERLAESIAKLADLVNQATTGAHSLRQLLEQGVKASTASRDAFREWFDQLQPLVQAVQSLIQAELEQAS